MSFLRERFCSFSQTVGLRLGRILVLVRLRGQPGDRPHQGVRGRLVHLQGGARLARGPGGGEVRYQGGDLRSYHTKQCVLLAYLLLVILLSYANFFLQKSEAFTFVRHMCHRAQVERISERCKSTQSTRRSISLKLELRTW